MKDLLQRLKGANAGQSGGPSQKGLALAAFGKHPGWDDHIPGIGLDTEPLAHVKQSLYVAGIGGQIDSGAWEKLDWDKRVPGFDHLFLWSRPERNLLGILWSSTDRKGRAKYPMVLCVQGDALSPGWMLRNLVPGLERLREACKATPSAATVESHCQTGQTQLRSMLSSADTATVEGLSDEGKRRFLDRPELGPDRIGLLRVLHELEAATKITSTDRGGSTVGSVHLRVPLSGDTRNQTLLLWHTFFRSVLPENVPLLLISRSGVEWLDVILGEPAPDDFYCLQTSLKGQPFSTAVPYELAPELTSKLQGIEAKFLGLQAPSVAAVLSKPAAPPIPTAPPPPAPQVSKAQPEVGGSVPSKRGPSLALFAGVGGVVVLALGALVFLNMNRAPQASKGAVAKGPEPAKPEVSSEAKANEPVRNPAYETALASGQAALAQGAYSNAVVQAQAALVAKPADAAATRLLADAQKAAQAAAVAASNRDYEASTNRAWLALQGHNYLEASNQLSIALRVRPGDSAAMSLLEQAKAGMQSLAAAEKKELAYRNATNASGSALAGGRLQEASDQAQVALGLKPGDAVAAALGAKAREGLQSLAAAEKKELAYRNATNASGSALAAGRFQEAADQAQTALILKPNDGAANALLADARKRIQASQLASQKERDYQAALEKATQALKAGNFIEATNQAVIAMELKPGDAAAGKVVQDANAQIALAARNEGDFRAAMSAGRAAMDAKDYEGARVQASRALTLKPADPAAVQLAQAAESQLKLAQEAAANEQKYQTALKAAQAAMSVTNLDAAVREATAALAAKPGDAAAAKLLADARAGKKELAAAPKPPPVTPAAAGTAIGAKKPDWTNELGMEFVWVPTLGGGGAYFGKYEVTQEQYRKIMGALPDRQAVANDTFPVANVTYTNATRFCELLSRKLGGSYSLPSQEEWRSVAGIAPDQDNSAWDILKPRLDHEVTNKDGDRTLPERVGSRGTQDNGIADLLGNVREWVVGEISAGFAFNSSVGNTKKLFLQGPFPRNNWQQDCTGFRCVARGAK